MKRVALFVTLLFSATCWAEMVARDQVGNYVVLKTDACQASPWLQKDWKQADMFYEGKRFRACWRLAGAEVYVLDAAGDVTILPAYAFKEETGV